MRVLVGITLFASILLLGTSGIIQQSYAGAGTPPFFRGDDCSVGYSYEEFGTLGLPTNPGTQFSIGTCSAGSINTDPALNDAFCDPPQPDPPQPGGVESQVVEGVSCHVHVPNFDDPFNTKLVQIQISYTGGLNPPIIDKVKPSPSSSPDCTFVDSTNPEQGSLIENWICHPNPDNERIWILLERDQRITFVVVDSVSFHEVGGIFEGVDTTSLLVTGAQMNAAWMIPVIVSAIGIGIVIARKF